ncbi:xanthine dehydrogenase family protein subunit M [Rhodobacteraceae bacterium N5(2021)]|uniref:Xanthine dehydrogenase family protein subunit M n=1 Tax=Gymnodinialimonas phycosphaerae TaxID=2841589 RepID=A0A975TY06_9RHOB|nr:xanthine dehydrogenase family protein subunit M [Gymnodinialimonas phycosphaerae]MBY4892792.1 xanthine dehydrogenase family protein subunit M [Gymnodinialimonas phycosphaerae]
MKAADFLYERPASLGDALALLADADRDAAPLAGGQSLMPMMNFRLAAPGMLVDLSGLDALRGITLEDGALRIGAMTRYVELTGSDLVSDHAPLIAQALPHIAHAAVRNRGTIGGSVALADPAAEMPALLLALDAVITVQSEEGSKDHAANDFFLGMYETALEPGELVTAITIPPRGDRRFAFYELARRHGDYAMAGVALSCATDRTDHRVAYFSIADRALRATAVEAVLDAGGAVDDAIAALEGLPFSGDLNASDATKKHLSGIVLKRALGGL